MTAKSANFPNQQMPTVKIPGLPVPKPPTLKVSVAPTQMFARGIGGGLRVLGQGAKKALGLIPAPIRRGVPALATMGLLGYGGGKALQATNRIVQEEARNNPSSLQQQQLYDTFRYGAFPSPDSY